MDGLERRHGLVDLVEQVLEPGLEAPAAGPRPGGERVMDALGLGDGRAQRIDSESTSASSGEESRAIAARAASTALQRPMSAGAVRSGAGARRASRRRSPTACASRSSKNVVTTSATQLTNANASSQPAPRTSAATTTPAGTSTFSGLVAALSTSARWSSRRRIRPYGRGSSVR